MCTGGNLEGVGHELGATSVILCANPRVGPWGGAHDKLRDALGADQPGNAQDVVLVKDFNISRRRSSSGNTMILPAAGSLNHVKIATTEARICDIWMSRGTASLDAGACGVGGGSPLSEHGV